MSAIDVIHGGELLSVDPPTATASEAERLLIDMYGINGRVAALSSERDQNFHVRAADGREYVLKIANAAEPPLTTEFQTAALLHVAERDGDLPVQRIVRARDGHAISHADVNGAMSAVRLMTYLPGLPQHRTERSPRQQVSLARWLARLDIALVDFEHSGANHTLLWDITHAQRVRALLSHIADGGRRAMATRVLDALERHVDPIQQLLRKQVIHNDINPHNVLVDSDDADEISGILDFGDMVRASLINELAIAASYVDFAGDNALDIVAGMAAAYHEILPLTEPELSVLTDLIAARQVITAAITEWRAQRYPENRAYIMRNNPSAWAGLEALARADRGRATDGILQACGATA